MVVFQQKIIVFQGEFSILPAFSIENSQQMNCCFVLLRCEREGELLVGIIMKPELYCRKVGVRIVVNVAEEVSSIAKTWRFS